MPKMFSLSDNDYRPLQPLYGRMGHIHNTLYATCILNVTNEAIERHGILEIINLDTGKSVFLLMEFVVLYSMND